MRALLRLGGATAGVFVSFVAVASGVTALVERLQLGRVNAFLGDVCGGLLPALAGGCAAGVLAALAAPRSAIGVAVVGVATYWITFVVAAYALHLYRFGLWWSAVAVSLLAAVATCLLTERLRARRRTEGQ